jgi:hypothetical protein
MDRHGNFLVGGSVAFLGIVTAVRYQGLPIIARQNGREDPVQMQLPGQKKLAPLFSLNFMGVGIVEPAAKVRQLLLQARQVLLR